MVSYESYLYDLALSPSTIQSYIADLKRFATYLGRPPETARPSDLVMYRNILSQHYQPASVNRHLASIARFLKFARSQGVTDVTLPEKLWQRKRRQTSPKSLDADEQQALVAAVNRYGSLRDICLIGLLLNCGLRSAEAANLELRDVTALWVHVRSGKGGYDREVPINAETRTIIRLYLDRRNGDGSPYFFIGERGRLTTKGVTYIVKKYAHIAKIGPCSPHRLRHSFAKRLVDSGVSLDKVSVLLGHSSLSVTAIYTRPSDGDLHQAVAKLEAVQRG